MQDLLHDPAVADAADKALAAAKAAAQAVAAAKAASKPAGDTAQADGGRRPRSRNRGRSTASNRQERSRSARRHGSRSRSRSARGAPAERGGPFRGLPEDAPLVPVRLVHVSGHVEWQLCGNEVFVTWVALLTCCFQAAMTQKCS